MNDDWSDLDMKTRRIINVMIVIVWLWLAFLACAISAVIFGAGRILGAW